MYSFIQLSELEQYKEEKLAQGFNIAAQGSNLDSLSRESEALPLSHRALQMGLDMTTSFGRCLCRSLYKKFCNTNILFIQSAYLLYLCLFVRWEHRPSTKERHRFLFVVILSISLLVYPISFVSFSVSLCQVLRGLPLRLFLVRLRVMA